MGKLDHKKIEKLVQKVKDGDSQAFASLYEMTYQSVYFFSVYLTHNESLAYDIVQETFIQVLKYINTLENGRLFVSWINKINYRVALNLMEKEKKHAGSDEEINYLADSNVNNDPLFSILKNEEKRELNEAIASLPLNYKTVILMKFYKNMKEKEIADALGVPIGTVKSRLNKAKQILKEKLNRKEEI